MIELLNAVPPSKGGVIPKPTQLLGNYEIVEIPVGAPGRMQNAAWMHGDEMFISGGSGSSGVTYGDTWALNLKTKTWRKTVDGPAWTGISGAYNEKRDKAYLVGGYSGGTYSNRRYTFDHPTETFITNTPGIGTSTGIAYPSVICDDDRMFMLGGYWSAGGIQYLRDLKVMNLDTETWVAYADAFPSTDSPNNVGMALYDGRLYYRAGGNLYSVLPNGTNRIAHSKPAGFNPLDSKYMFEFGGDLYFVCRVDSSGQQSHLVKYSIQDDAWTLFDRMPEAARNQVTSVVYWNGALWSWSGMNLANNTLYPNVLVKIT